jgi:hypothetical protein
MKVVVFGEEKGMYGGNLVKWLNAAGHQAVAWRKFYPEGNKLTAQQCPISNPDVILLLGNFCTWEDLPYMGIENKPKRIYVNLGNKNISGMTRDWRIGMFSDHFISYNPEHKHYQVKERADRFANLKCLPLPFDGTKLTPQDYSNSTLKICQTLSAIAMMGAYSKHTSLIGNACKVHDVEFDLIFDLPGKEALARKKLSPVLFDSCGGMFGVSSIEGWALGQAIVGYVEQPILDEYEALLGAPPPVIQASSHAELLTVVEQLKSGAIDWKAKCLESKNFIENYYTPAKITQAYVNYFESIL